jgi:hypothetical protein
VASTIEVSGHIDILNNAANDMFCSKSFDLCDQFDSDGIKQTYIILDDSNYSENVLICAAGTCETDNEPDESDLIEHSDWIAHAIDSDWCRLDKNYITTLLCRLVH